MKKTKPAVKKQIKYDPAKIEKKWQKQWQIKKLYSTKDPSGKDKDKFYVLDMFPYPSGEGLHVGHPKGYIATDIVSRFKRMHGHRVLHPMGFDAFGLPAENYALKTKTNPVDSVKKNVARYKKQLEILGFDYDWSREVNTTDPKYYKWTQWIFLQLFKKGLAYESFEPINWCPSCKTGLANEDIEDGKCERCGTPIEKKPMRQWVLKITDYADRLLHDLDAIDLSESPHIIDKKWPPRPGKKVVERRTIHALVRDPKTNKYLGLKWHKFPWITFIVGGVEQGEDIIEAAKREVGEETGYTDLKFIRLLGGPVKAEYFAAHKDQNRIAITTGVLFELASDARNDVSEHEKEAHETIWMDMKDMNPEVMTCAELPVWIDRLNDESKCANPQPKPLLDWPESIKELQRNWIGKSEGAELGFKIKGIENSVKVFTTRPDTLFGVTYVVLAPDHKLVTELLSKVSNREDVEKYIFEVKKKSDIERTDATKDKTGVELKGITVINPANGEEVPLWIADYVLADYGTGAVMAVPAHDERDWEFAHKFKLPMKQVIAPMFTKNSGDDMPRSDKETSRRRNLHAIVKHWSDNKYLLLDWKQTGWKSFIVGGAEDGEDDIVAAGREILEETGYKNAKFVRTVGPEYHTHHYISHKDVNRYGICKGLYFELSNGEKVDIDASENTKHESKWIDEDKVAEFINLENNKFMWNLFKNGENAFVDEGILINSGEFTDGLSQEVRKQITKFAEGKWVSTYKIRDWVFSRQRYWGEPIPVIHCKRHGVVSVPEKDLPVILPRVKSYEPTGTGESPLAKIDKWVNTKCPICNEPAKRETNTMPQWAGSSWYYLRYIDPKNVKTLVDPKKEKHWSPVDLYVGGAEHATRHLIYARFWHKFLYDINAVSEIEPFKKLQSVGLIMGEDGRKMSKRFGNVVNPDEVVKTYGADTLRIYEMFMGPFDQQISWSTSSMVGARRFIEKIWKLQEKVVADKKDSATQAESTLNRSLHKTIRKVSADIDGLRFNTAISSLMILVQEYEKVTSISKIHWNTLLQILAPFAPHVTEELWSKIGNKGSIHSSTWPKFDEEAAKDDTVKIMVQVNGRLRASFEAPNGSANSELENSAKELAEVKKWTDGKEIKKVIVIQNRLVNIVLT